MLYTQDTISQVALRIERAFRRRYPQWNPAGVTPGVWESAASRLLEASMDRSGFPIDPELFVTIQEQSRISPDPWALLTQQSSLTAYRKTLKRIIGKLRRELKAEIARGECRLLRGLKIDEVLETEGSRLSPLSRYILARRAGRFDLSQKHHAAALNQHRSCPLYRLAARSLLPVHAYPTIGMATSTREVGQEIVAFSNN